jgi:uncharacterized protein with PIN domain
MQVTMYIYTNTLTAEETLMRCLKCNRALFKYSADQVVIANIAGSKDIFEPGSHYIEHQCHSCRSLYKVLFQ